MIAKRNHLHTEIKKAKEKARGLVKQGKKDEAIYFLGKKKIMDKNLKNVDTKLNFLNGQIDKIEQITDDVEFTNTVKESNEVLKDLMQRLDVDAVREAGDLQREVDVNSEEIRYIIDQNKEDEDIMKEFEMLGQEEDGDIIEEVKPVDVVQNKKDKEVMLN